jgi:hypothetical protein
MIKYTITCLAVAVATSILWDACDLPMPCPPGTLLPRCVLFVVAFHGILAIVEGLTGQTKGPIK